MFVLLSFSKTSESSKLYRVLKKCRSKFCSWFELPEESQCFDIYFFSIYPMYRVLFTLCSLLGLSLSGYFYCLCLPYIFIKIDVIQHVIKAVGGRGKLLTIQA